MAPKREVEKAAIITVRLDEDVNRRLDALSKSSQVPKSVLVRTGIKWMIDELEAHYQAPGSTRES